MKEWRGGNPGAARLATVAAEVAEELDEVLLERLAVEVEVEPEPEDGVLGIDDIGGACNCCTRLLL